MVTKLRQVEVLVG